MPRFQMPSTLVRVARGLALGAIVAAVAPAPTAHAGGLGPYLMGGFHSEPVYYYSSELDSGAGPRIPDQNEYEQYKDAQIIANAGAGLELVLGDRDDLIQGVFRGFWMMDGPQSDPARLGLVDEDALVSVYRDTLRHTGVGTVGMQWGVWRGASDRLKFSLAAHVGAGFVSQDNEQFFLAQAGTNLSYLINRTAEFYVDVNYAFRVRKTISNGLIGAVGIRVLFD